MPIRVRLSRFDRVVADFGHCRTAPLLASAGYGPIVFPIQHEKEVVDNFKEEKRKTHLRLVEDVTGEQRKHRPFNLWWAPGRHEQRLERRLIESVDKPGKGVDSPTYAPLKALEPCAIVRSTAQEGIDHAGTDGAAVQREVHAAGK